MSISGKEMTVDIAGLGIILYSPKFVEDIPEGEDYLASHYATEEQVQAHIQAGTIVSFGTGSPGIFILKFRVGYPNPEVHERSRYKLRLGLHCCDGKVCFRDLYDLLDWYADCPADQILDLDDGFYHVTLCSNPPPSGIVGDRQEIFVYFQRLEAMPRLAREGIPTLWAPSKDESP